MINFGHFPSSWTSDDTINNYFEMLEKNNQHIKCVSSFFYELMNRSDKSNAKYMMKNYEKASIVFVPFFRNHHWSLIVIDNHKKTIEVYDSMIDPLKQLMYHIVLNEIKSFVCDEINDCIDAYKVIVHSDIKQQIGCDDCGIFVCWYAGKIIQNDPIVFGKDFKKMDDFRADMRNTK